jgi:hypothetical protein
MNREGKAGNEQARTDSVASYSLDTVSTDLTKLQAGQLLYHLGSEGT